MRAVLGAVGLGLIGPATSAFAQCAMCGTALQDGGDPLTRGVLYSTIFLISLPYAIFGSFVAVLVWRSRRARADSSPPRGVRLGLVSGGSKEEGQ